jgi:hypothetical protein
MPTKSFNHTVKFYNVRNRSLGLPLVQVDIIPQNKKPFSLSLLFDTGADITILRADLYPSLGLNSWDEGTAVQIDGIGGRTTHYRYDTTIELFGKVIDCPIHLARLAPNPLFSGLLGRETVFKEFGFGFWESLHELYISTNP